MSYLPINPCPKCGSRQRGMWLGGEGRPWKIICQHCGLEQWSEPTFEQIQVLRKLSGTNKVTEKQREALETVIRWWEDR